MMAYLDKIGIGIAEGHTRLKSQKLRKTPRKLTTSLSILKLIMLIKCSCKNMR